jgi:GDPmannose 4,6-dehydratase
VRELIEVAFGHAGLEWQKFVSLDERFLRPAEVDLLIGTPAKAKEKLGWTPTVDFGGLVRMMVDADLERLSRAPLPARVAR